MAECANNVLVEPEWLEDHLDDASIRIVEVDENPGLAYWYLKYYGHEHVKLLSGPREHWIAAGRPTTAAPTNHAPTRFIAKPGNAAIRARRTNVPQRPDREWVIDPRTPARSQRS